MWCSIVARSSSGTSTSSGSGTRAASAPTRAPSQTCAASRLREPGTPRRWSNLLTCRCPRESDPRTTWLGWIPIPIRSSIYAAEDRIPHGEVHDHVGDVAVQAHVVQRLQVHERRIPHVHARGLG